LKAAIFQSQTAAIPRAGADGRTTSNRTDIVSIVRANAFLTIVLSDETTYLFGAGFC